MGEVVHGHVTTPTLLTLNNHRSNKGDQKNSVDCLLQSRITFVDPRKIPILQPKLRIMANNKKLTIKDTFTLGTTPKIGVHIRPAYLP